MVLVKKRGKGTHTHTEKEDLERLCVYFMIICIGYFVTELRLIENDKLGDNVTLIMTTVWFLKNYFDIDFTVYGVSSYDIGIGFGHFAIATPDVSFIFILLEDC